MNEAAVENPQPGPQPAGPGRCAGGGSSEPVLLVQLQPGGPGRQAVLTQEPPSAPTLPL